MTDDLTLADVLAINGVSITAEAASTYAFIIDVNETASSRFDLLEAWLRRNTAPMRGGS